MKTNLKNLSDIAAKAIDTFSSNTDNPTVILGITDKTLRQQGLNADAITIDSITQGEKIVILIHDDKPNIIDVALGNKEGDIHSSTEYPIDDITETFIKKIMMENFVNNKKDSKSP